MYLIELNDDELESVASDAEYFTASEDEYFSADDNDAISSHSYSSSGGKHTTQTSSKYSASFSYKSLKSQQSSGSSAIDKIRWTVDESEPRGKYRLKKHVYVEPLIMKNYYLWRRLILSGNHPRDAATIIGSQFCYKQVKQKKSIQLFSIRLNHEHRVYFMIQEKERIVKILNIGGHAFG